MKLVKIKVKGPTNKFNAEHPNSVLFLNHCDDVDYALLLIKDNRYTRADAELYFEEVEFGDVVNLNIGDSSPQEILLDYLESKTSPIYKAVIERELDMEFTSNGAQKDSKEFYETIEPLLADGSVIKVGNGLYEINRSR